MKFSFWDKTRNRYRLYKSRGKYSDLAIVFLFIIILFIEIILVISIKILKEISYVIQKHIEQVRIENQIRQQRQMELRRIYEENRAAGMGYQSGVTRSKYQTKMRINEQKKQSSFNRRYQKNAEHNMERLLGWWR